MAITTEELLRNRRGALHGLSVEERDKYTRRGQASYYDNASVDPRWGGVTKSGEKFDETQMTAAVRPEDWKQFKGKTVRVRNTANNKTIDVKINDTGGFGKYNRAVDLSKGAFEKIADPKKGVADIEMEIIEPEVKKKGLDISSLNPFQVKKAEAGEIPGKKTISTQELMAKKGKNTITTKELLAKGKKRKFDLEGTTGLEEARSKLGLGEGAIEGGKPYTNSWQYPIASLYHQVEKAGRAIIGLPWQVAQEFPNRVFGKYKEKFEKMIPYPDESKSAIGRGIQEIHNEINKQAEYWKQPGPITKRVLATRDLIKQSAKKGLGDTGEVLSDLMFMGEDMGSMLIQMALIGKVSPSQISQVLNLSRYGKLAAHGFFTTQGTINERAKSAIYRVAYNLTPAIVNATGLIGLKATATDILLNSWITSPSYVKLLQEKGLKKEFFKQSLPLFFADVVMALSTRGLPQNQRKAIMDKHYKDWVKKAPELRLPKDEIDAIHDKVDEVIKETLVSKPPSEVGVSKEKEQAKVEEPVKETLEQKYNREQAEKKAKVKEIPAKPGLKVLPKKAQLLIQLDEAIAKAPSKADAGDKPGKVTFETDGGANIINTKESLTAFRDIIKKTAPTMKETTAPKSPLGSTAGKKEDIDPLLKGAPEGYFTDGKMIIRGKPPKKAKVSDRPALGKEQHKQINDFLNAKTKPAEFQYYFIDTPDKEVYGKSTEPIAKSGDTTANVTFKSEDGYYVYKQDKFNAIRNRYPNATYGISQEGMLIASYQGKPVAVLLPIQYGNQKSTADGLKGMTDEPIRGGEEQVLEKPMPVTKKALNGYSSPQFKTEEEATQWMIDRGFKKEWIKISKGRTTTVSTGEFREYYYANPNRNYIDEIIEKGKELARPTPSKGGEIDIFKYDITGKENRFKESTAGREDLGLKAIEKNRKIVQQKLIESINYEKTDKAKFEAKMREAIVLAKKSNEVLFAFEKEYGNYRQPYDIDAMKRKVTPSKGGLTKRLTTQQLKAKKKSYKAASIDPNEIHNAFDKTPDPKKRQEGGPKLPSWKPKQIPPTTSSQEEISFPIEGGRHITKIYEKEIGPVLQISKRFKKFAGVYFGSHKQDRGSGLIRVKNFDNFHILAHETGHFLDDVLAKYPLTKDQKLELLEVTKWRLPFTEKYVYGVSEKTGKATRQADRYTAYRKSRTELFADYMGVLITKPEIAEKLAPQFTAVVKGEIAKDREFAWIVNKMREYFKEFQGLKDYVDGLRKIPEIEPHIKAWTEQGNLLQNLWRNKIGNIVWDKVSRFVDRIGQTRAGQVITEKKGLSDTTFEILRQRRHLIDGQFLRSVEEIIRPISKLSKDDQERVTDNLQRFEILEPTSELNRLSETARQELAVWGNEAKKLGLLNEEAFWDQVGQYFPFFYETKEFAQNKAQFGFGISKTLRANLNSFKHRMTNEEFGRRYLEAKWGNWPSTKAKIDKISSKELIRLGIEARKEYGLIKTAPYPLQKRLKLLMQSVYTTKALNSIASQPGILGTKDMPGYVKLPNGKSLGNLSGQYVPENLAKEINSFSEKVSDLGRAVEAVVGTWKNFKVPWDPAAMARNATTNMIAGWMADIPTWKPQVVLSGINSFIKKDNVYELLRDRGMYRHTYSEVELGKLAFIMETEPDTTMGHIIKWATTAFDTPGKIYGAIEDASKTVIAKYAHSQGASIEQAIKLADKWLFDYSSISPLVGTLRKLPVPFLTWSAKTFPRLVETAIRKPEKYATVYLALAVINAMSRKGLGISQEEEEKMKPEYLRGKTKPVMLLPIRDKDNQVQWIDFTYYVPWGGWITPMTKGSIIPQPLQMSNPLMTLYNAYGTNYDPFIGQIQKPYMTEQEKKDTQNKYIQASLLPDLLGGLGSRKIIKGIRKAPEDYDYYGRKPQLGQILVGELLGLKLTKGGETTTKVSNFEREEKERVSQANREATLAWQEFYRNKNQENLRKAQDLTRKVRPSYREQLKKKARENVKFETSPQRKMLEKLSGPQRERFRRY